MSHSRTGKRIALLAGCVVVVVVGVAAWVCREHIRFVWLFESVGENEQGFPEYRHRQTGIVFVSLPGGTFMMGSSKDEGEKAVDHFVVDMGEGARKMIVKWTAAEQPQHEVKLSPFLISKHEVTQAEWVQVTGENPSGFEGATRPVENISWEDCQAFNKKTGLKLPTEAQWEYACRAGKQGSFAGTGRLEDMGWFASNYRSKTHPVGQKQSNDFGLYDMHGNIFEWCQDVFDSEFYSRTEALRKDPLCTSGSESRVVRGGGWYFDAGICRSAFRFNYRPSNRQNFVGFRPSWSPSP